MTTAAVVLPACTLGGVWVIARLWRSPAPPVAFSSCDWVLIGDFENRTGDPAFDDVLERALTR